MHIPKTPHRTTNGRIRFVKQKFLFYKLTFPPAQFIISTRNNNKILYYKSRTFKKAVWSPMMKSFLPESKFIGFYATWGDEMREVISCYLPHRNYGRLESATFLLQGTEEYSLNSFISDHWYRNVNNAHHTVIDCLQTTASETSAKALVR